MVEEHGSGEEGRLSGGTSGGRRAPGNGRWNSSAVRLLRTLFLAMLLFGASLAIIAGLWLYAGPAFILQLLVVAVVAYFVAGGRLRWVYVALKTAPRDLKLVLSFSSFLSFHAL